MTDVELLVTLMVKYANHPVDQIGLTGMKLFAEKFARANVLDKDNTFMCRTIGKALVEYADTKDADKNREG